jgi:hypothetical protein
MPRFGAALKRLWFLASVLWAGTFIVLFVYSPRRNSEYHHGFDWVYLAIAPLVPLSGLAIYWICTGRLNPFRDD